MAEQRPGYHNMWFLDVSRASRAPVFGRFLLLPTLGLLLAVIFAPAASAALPSFDFTQPTDVQGWERDHDLEALEPTPDGLRLRITGADPYLHGPARDYPGGMLLWLNVRLKSDQGGTAQVFYFTGASAEENSVRFDVIAGEWQTARVPIPALGDGYHLRFDPPGDGASCVLQKLWVDERATLTAPAWPKPPVPDMGAKPLQIRSGALRLVHNRSQWGGFHIEAGNEPAAIGQVNARVGYQLDGETQWTGPDLAARQETSVHPQGKGFRVDAAWSDSDGARWTVQQTFQAGALDEIVVSTRLSVDRDRLVVYAPMFTMFPGVGSHGTNKNQGLFAGLEYLENEPSSSEADVEGPESWRLAPDAFKLTFPLMALQSGQHWVGLIWEPEKNTAAVHDSPDRQFGSGGHLMGLIRPGSDGSNREERNLLPYGGVAMKPGEPWLAQATLIGGRGTNILPAVQHFVRRRGLPQLLEHGYTDMAYYELAARGWLDSAAREGARYRHAVWPGFNAQPASDAAVWMEWLAARLAGTPWASRLETAASEAWKDIPPQALNDAQISHNRSPLPALIHGSVPGNARQAAERGRDLLQRFDSDGVVFYHRGASGTDYGRTHTSQEATGLAGEAVASVLEAALFSGDRELIDAGLRHLRGLRRFDNGIPRGAQTWEVPLHTPDILASAHMVRAYVAGFELTGDPEFLERARYWAWTGVPFIYLQPSFEKPVGTYSTIPVLGATSWKAPVWLGRPVQWCGLVYAQALRQLTPHDPRGPWKQLADGIAAAGLQHTWTAEDSKRVGLLPDYYLLKTQRSDGPAINPATLLVPAIELFQGPAPYARQVFKRRGAIVHAPGRLEDVRESADEVSFRVLPWSSRPVWVLVTGLRNVPRVTVNQQPFPPGETHLFEAASGRLALKIRGDASIQVQ